MAPLGSIGEEWGSARYPPPFPPPQGERVLIGEGGIAHRQAVSLLSAASTGISSLAPVALFLSSTVPLARPRGPRTSCQGKPMRSMVANLAPADSSRSS